MAASPASAEPRIAVFGSCVTRDFFEDPALQPHLVHYAARSSVISAVAPPVELRPDEIALDSAFQRRCVLADFHKTFFASLAEAAPDWLLIDLVDERFDVVRTAGSFVTRSSAFQDAGLDDAGLGEVLPRLSDEALGLLDGAAAEFVERLGPVVPPERIVVHRAVWAERYRAAGAVEPFPAPRLRFARRQNEALERGYDAFEALGVTTLAHDAPRYVADADHRWGLEPFHYEPAYNADGVRSLRRATGMEAA